ncbi:nucleotide exchange factor GrpE [Nanchangia anserum]|uniref:Protein GrpE n=1 Tax=Nanchangia anserum TaxID=2692125 RepID=A0A8I0GEL4_9ACTO|nr:nucleotide exchange factor GrpE [Nanchangia anserum]MBD3689427.1 nucleotide exchange factor GrpE [Nanchangia anserum]QOX81631.1 nucleotide exchange factor GrpE [Nanchangia anserum]
MENPDRGSGVFSEATSQAGADQPAPATGAGRTGEDAPASSSDEVTPEAAADSAATQSSAEEPATSDGDGDQPEAGKAEDSAESVDTTEAEDSPDADSASDTPAGDNLADLKGQVAQLSDDLARSRAETYNVQREYSAYVRRAKQQAGSHREDGRREVCEALLSVLDDIQAARDADDLSGPFAAIATKLEQTLGTVCQLERYGEAGEEFDPMRHDALMANESADVDTPTIAQVLQPGYRMGERVLRATKVMVHNPQ